MRTNRSLFSGSIFALLAGIASCGNDGTSGMETMTPDLAQPPPPPQPTCTDGIKNGTESDIDCGSACSAKCAIGKACGGDPDCVTGLFCKGGVCVAPSCMDGFKNQDEVDVDCGGASCGKCGAGAACGGDGDCTSAACDASKCVTKPTFTAVAPLCGPTAGGTALTLTGTDFAAKAGLSVLLGQVAATSVLVPSATSITALSPAGTAGKVAVSITGLPGGLLSLPMAFTYVDTTPANITLGTEAGSGFAPSTSLAVADFFGADNRPDWIEDHGGAHLDTGVGQVGGSFLNGPTSLATFGAARRLVAVDLNGDKFSEVIGTEGNNVSVHISSGSTLTSRVDYPVDLTPEGLVLGDFDADGKQDVATIHSGADQVSVLLGNGDGTLKAKVDYAAPRGTRIAAADFDGDGKPDLAVTSLGNMQVNVLINNGNGTFKAAVAYTLPSLATSLVAADFNGDGKADLVAAVSGSLSFLANNGNGTFGAAVNTMIPASMGIPVIQAGDIDGNGYNDIALINTMSNRIELWLNTCGGRFVDAGKSIASATTTDLVLVDLNNDKKLDLVWVNSTGVRNSIRQ